LTCCDLGSAGRPAFFNPLRRPAFEPGGESALLIIGQSRRCANRIFNQSPRPVAEIRTLQNEVCGRPAEARAAKIDADL